MNVKFVNFLKPWAVPGIFVIFGFVVGWAVHNHLIKDLKEKPTPIRLGGFNFVQPLLVCDSSQAITPEKLRPLEDKLKGVLKKATEQKQIESSSVYFRNLKTSEEVEINGSEKFYPASLRKVPLMLAFYKAVENKPDSLEKVRINVGGTDQNSKQEIEPKEYAEIGKTYTLNDLIEKMILYSDNNAAMALSSLAGTDSLKFLFENLQIPFIDFNRNDLGKEDLQSITAREFSLFFRVLYNATYLNTEFSEKAMELLTRVDFKKGIVAGVPPEVKVAHKFGLTSLEQGDKAVFVEREFHDCGVVFYSDSPYILCIMVKSKAEIPKIEEFFKEVSGLVYQEQVSIYQGAKRP